jgi:hypothetical protein
MAKAAKACIFCGTRKVSREHVWSQWISRLIIGDGLPGYSWTIERQAPDGSSVVVGQGDGNFISVKARCVCQRCNNGWMSDLEEHCKPLLGPMILGDGIHLSRADRSDIAAWCALKAMVYEYALWTTDRIIPADAHQWLYDNRKQRLAPPEMSVWLSAYRGEAQEAGRAWHRRGNAQMERSSLGQIYWTTILVGHLVFQVAGFAPTQRWQVEHPGEARCVSMSLWPVDVASSKKWPPSRILTDGTIHGFAEIEPELLVTGRLPSLPAE